MKGTGLDDEDDDEEEEDDDELEDNDKHNDNNKDNNDNKGISARERDRDLGFLRGHQRNQPHDDDEEDNEVTRVSQLWN